MSPVNTAPAALRRNDAQLRARYLGEVLDVLYPASNWDEHVDYLIIPHARRPRLLVPAHDRRLAAAAVRRYAEPQTRLARWQRTAVVAALRTGIARILLRDRLRVPAPAGAADSIDAYLSQVLGIDLHLSVHLGPARANRKPVLQLLNPEGRTVAFAKLGTSDLTRRLVRAETSALAVLDRLDLRHLTVPRVRHAGRWNSHEVLVQSALPVWRPRAAKNDERLALAMREVARCCGVRRGPLRDSGYWKRLSDRLATLAAYPEGPALQRAAERILAVAGSVDLEYGSWHGDWSPWNMAMVADTILVWDWERFTTGVPTGFDALHHRLQCNIAAATGGDAGAAVGAMLDDAAALLQPFGALNRREADVVALLYLIDLAARYLADRQAEAGAPLGVLGTWLLPVLVARAGTLAGPSSVVAPSAKLVHQGARDTTTSGKL
ncbi:MAG TPA: hypothetical protein VK453_10540 [Micromonosporaceae bacterium]|nr:hypothetical protein [Micromonosporaceae bacterium]